MLVESLQEARLRQIRHEKTHVATDNGGGMGLWIRVMYRWVENPVVAAGWWGRCG